MSEFEMSDRAKFDALFEAAIQSRQDINALTAVIATLVENSERVSGDITKMVEAIKLVHDELIHHREHEHGAD